MTYREELISAPKNKVRKLLEKLKINSATQKMVADMLAEKGLKTQVSTLEKEWLNEVLAAGVNSEYLSEAEDNPSTSFLRFALSYADNPRDPGARVVKKLMQSLGYEFAGSFYKIQWPVEIAWAERLRIHGDDLVCVCSDLFLKLIDTKGPNKVFSELLKYTHEQGHPAPSSSKEINHLSPEEISTYPVDDIDFTPNFIGYVKSTSERTLNKIPEELLSGHAQKIRERYLDEHATLEVSTTINYLSSYPLTYRHMIAMQAVKAGIDTSTFSAIHEDFIDHIRSMRIIKPAEDLEFEFSRFLEDRCSQKPKKKPGARSNNEEAKEAVSLLSLRWQKNLPAAFQDLDASTSTNFSEWRDQILDGKRGNPSDLTLDYYLFLLAKRYS